MKTFKSLSLKKTGKQDREKKVLLGLVDYFLKTGKPVGSQTLKEAGFDDLSSATLRNYFAHLEEMGYLKQQHVSGGRIPTQLAYRLYAKEALDTDLFQVSFPKIPELEVLKSIETREIALFLQQSAELLSKLANTAVFLSAPRFDHDYVMDIKLVSIDSTRCLCILVTDFGMIQTEVLYVDCKLSSFSIKRIESYFLWRLNGQNKPENLDSIEETIAQKFYNEVIVRYLVSYSNFLNEEIYRTGFSKLLSYPELSEPATLASTLSLFENAHSMRLLLREPCKLNRLRFWIGDDLTHFSFLSTDCAVLAVPYYINTRSVGSIALLGPMRIPYPYLFYLLKSFSECLSEGITKSLYKFKIQFRQPEQKAYYLQQKNQTQTQNHQPLMMLLENKTRRSP